MIRSIIIENEKSHSDHLITLLSTHFPEIDILAVCVSVPDGVREINEQKPELIFLDIEFTPNSTGFDLLDQTHGVPCEVIFTTNYNQYAAKAFRLCALDFLEKQIELSELKEAIDRYRSIKGMGRRQNIEALLYNLHQPDAAMQKVGIPVLGGYDFIAISEIIICRSVNNCAEIYLTQNKKITVTKTLKWVEQLMRDHAFFRIHDSALINLHHIVKYKKSNEGGTVELTDRIEADVSRRKKDDFIRHLSRIGMI